MRNGNGESASVNAWLVGQYQARRLPASPAGELQAAETALQRAEAAGDQEAVNAANERLDAMFAQTREEAAEEHRAAAAAMRSSSGVRAPIRRKPSANAVMDSIILSRARGF